MQHLFYISPRRMTSAIQDATTEDRLPVLNELVRPHLDHIQDQSGDLVHKDLESAKRLAIDLLFDLGDKRMDILRIDVPDDLFERLTATGDIVDSDRPDCFGSPMLWLTQQGCIAVNNGCLSMSATNLTFDQGSQVDIDGAPYMVH